MEVVLTVALAGELSLPLIGTSQDPLLQRLNPLSFATLSHLTYSLICELSAEAESDFQLEDPYYGLADTLAGFTHLESLQINLAFYGQLGHVDGETSFGPQWGTICDTLASPGAFPTLKDVSVVIHVCTVDHESIGITPCWQFVDPQGPERFREQVFESVYPAQFQSLIELDAVGTMSFSFAVKLSTGPYAQLVNSI
jgi:hypothetical protein